MEGKGGEINKRREVRGRGDGGKRKIRATRETPTVFGGHGKRGEMSFADFSRSKADVVLTRGCINSILLVILPDCYGNRVILHSRTCREKRNDRNRELLYLGKYTFSNIFLWLYFASWFRHYNEHSLLNNAATRAPVLRCRKIRGNYFSLASRRSRKSGTPESDFPARWSDFLYSLYCFLDFPPCPAIHLAPKILPFPFSFPVILSH